METQENANIRDVKASPEFKEFYGSLGERVQKKFDFVINVMSTIKNVPATFVRHLTGSDLYEMRVSVGSNEYRSVLFTMDNSNFIEATKVILLNGFLKKSTKDYRKQIVIAHNILNLIKS